MGYADGQPAVVKAQDRETIFQASSRFTWSENLYTIAATGVVQVAKANQMRFALLFAVSTSQYCNISTTRFPAGAQGWYGSYNFPWYLTYAQYGSLVQAAWFAANSTATTLLTVWECTVVMG